VIPLEKSCVIGTRVIAAVTVEALGSGHGCSQAIRLGLISIPGQILVSRNSLAAVHDMARHTIGSGKRTVFGPSRAPRAGSPEMAAQAAAPEQVVRQGARVFSSGQELQPCDGRSRIAWPCIRLGSPEKPSLVDDPARGGHEGSLYPSVLIIMTAAAGVSRMSEICRVAYEPPRRTGAIRLVFMATGTHRAR